VPLDLRQINGQMGAYSRYGMAKLANIAFSSELARRLNEHAEAGLVLSNAVHPGVVATEMLRLDNFEAMLGQGVGFVAWGLAQLRNALFAYSSRTAAVSVLHAAVAPQVEEQRQSGLLFVPVATPWPPRHDKARDPVFAKELWEFSEKLVNDALSS